MAKDAKNDPKNYYPRYATDNCSDCNDMYYTKWGRVRATNYDLFLPDNNIIAACRNEKGFYPYRDERGLGMSELAEPVDYALAASGALSLGTTAGTDRSISAEFGGSTPHALSEYYDAASGIPASGTIDFSDFHGTSAATQEFRFLIAAISANTGSAIDCLRCDICCMFNCCIHPSGDSLHGCLDFVHQVVSTNINTVATSIASCHATHNYNAIFFGGNYATDVGGIQHCLCCMAENGVGVLGGVWNGAMFPNGIFGQNYNTGFNTKFRVVAPCGDNSLQGSNYYNFNNNYSFGSSHGLPADASTHPIACCVVCLVGGWQSQICCQCLNDCVITGSNSWICCGQFGTGLTTVANIAAYGDPCNRYSGAGRIVALNLNFTNYCFRGCGDWQICSGKNQSRLVTNSLIWAARGAL